MQRTKGFAVLLRSDVRRFFRYVEPLACPWPLIGKMLYGQAEAFFVMVKRTLLCIGILALTACSTDEEPDQDIVEGHYRAGFEMSDFRPCGAEEWMWTSSDDAGSRSDSAFAVLFENYYATVKDGYKPAFVRLRGRASEPGSYGHLSIYEREFIVQDVLAVRPSRLWDCW